MSADGNELDWVERTKVAIGQSKGQVSRENVREVHRTSPLQTAQIWTWFSM